MAFRKAVPIALMGFIGAVGLSMLQASEGLSLKAYRDPVGITTICWGHTGPEVRMGQTLTRDQCEKILLRDVQIAQRYIVPASKTSCLGGAPLTANQRDALTSFVFNIGGPKFCSSTMAKRLKAGDYLGASRQFPLWDKAKVNGKLVALRGLTIRRAEERKLFLSVSRTEATTALSPGALALLTQPSTGK